MFAFRFERASRRAGTELRESRMTFFGLAATLLLARKSRTLGGGFFEAVRWELRF